MKDACARRRAWRWKGGPHPHTSPYHGCLRSIACQPMLLKRVPRSGVKLLFHDPIVLRVQATQTGDGDRGSRILPSGKDCTCLPSPLSWKLDGSAAHSVFEPEKASMLVLPVPCVWAAGGAGHARTAPPIVSPRVGMGCVLHGHVHSLGIHPHVCASPFSRWRLPISFPLPTPPLLSSACISLSLEGNWDRSQPSVPPPPRASNRIPAEGALPPP